MLFLAGMNYEKDRDSSGRADRMPALFVVNHAIRIGDDARILKDPGRRFKRNAVLPAIDAILGLNPCEDHVYIQNCSTNVSGSSVSQAEKTGRLKKSRAALPPNGQPGLEVCRSLGCVERPDGRERRSRDCPPFCPGSPATMCGMYQPRLGHRGCSRSDTIVTAARTEGAFMVVSSFRSYPIYADEST